MKDYRERGLAIATSAPELLQQLFRRSRLLPVDDEPDVGHVETHAKCVGADDVFRCRKALPKRAFDEFLPLPGRAEARMVQRDVQPSGSQCLLQLLSYAN